MADTHYKRRRSKTVLLSLQCFQNFAELHFGQESGLAHSTVLLGGNTIVDFAFRPLSACFKLLLDFT